MSRSSSPTIGAITVRAVRVPMTEPHRTASGVISESPLVLTDIITDAGISGHSIVFTYTAAALKPTADLIQDIEALVKGILAEPLLVQNGHAIVSDSVGSGVEWNNDAVQRFAA